MNFFSNYILDKSDKKKDSAASGQSVDVKKKEKDNNNVKEETEEKTGVNKKKIPKDDGSDIGEEGKNAEKKQGETATGQTLGSVKPVKKKVIRKVVKQKVVNKANDAASKQLDKSDEKDGAEKIETSNVPIQGDKSSVGPSGVHTPMKSLVAEDISMGKTDGEEGKDKEINSSEDKSQDKPDPTGNAVVNDATVKTIKKKKIIKRVPKKKVVGEASKSVSEPKNGGNAVAVNAEDGTQSTGKQTADADTIATEVKKAVKIVPKKKLKTPSFVKQDDTANSNKTETKSDKDDKKDEGNAVPAQTQDVTQSTGKQTADANTSVAEVKKTVKVVPKIKSKATSEKQDGTADSNKNEMKSDKDDKKDERGVEKSGAKVDKQKASEKDIHNVKGKLKDGDKSKDGKGTKERDGKDEPRSKSNKEVKEKRKSDEPPRHPGFILQTKWAKDTKVW